MNDRPNLIVFAALAWILIIGFVLFTDGGQTSNPQIAQSQAAVQPAPAHTPTPVQPAIAGGQGGYKPQGDPPSLQSMTNDQANPQSMGITALDKAASEADPTAFASPYDNYVVTQGPHDQWMGELAIDIAAGNGATIKSPINGGITQLFTDQWGNPNLIIENSVYIVTMMHGNYTVKVGDQVTIGQPVGTESNHGYTLDWNGNLCTNRDCGYHTHLNVFDKRINDNVDARILLGKW